MLATSLFEALNLSSFNEKKLAIVSNEHGSCLEQMNTIFRIVSICLGTPPKTFTWEYTDKSKKYHKVADISPLEFYNQHVRSVVSRIKSMISELHLKAGVCIFS